MNMNTDAEIVNKILANIIFFKIMHHDHVEIVLGNKGGPTMEVLSVYSPHKQFFFSKRTVLFSIDTEKGI